MLASLFLIEKYFSLKICHASLLCWIFGNVGQKKGLQCKQHSVQNNSYLARNIIIIIIFSARALWSNHISLQALVNVYMLPDMPLICKWIQFSGCTSFCTIRTSILRASFSASFFRSKTSFPQQLVRLKAHFWFGLLQ